MRQYVIALACLSFIAPAGCSAAPTPVPVPSTERPSGGHRTEKMPTIGDEDVCQLVSMAHIGKSFGFQVDHTIPYELPTKSSINVSCMYASKSDDESRDFAVFVDVHFYSRRDIHGALRLYEARSGNVGQRVAGLADLAMYYPTVRLSRDSTSEPWSGLDAYDQFADGVRKVQVRRTSGTAALPKLESVVREVLRVLDKASG